MTLSDLLAWVEDLMEPKHRGCSICGSQDHEERIVSCGAYVPCSVVVCPETGETNSYV